MGSNWKEEARDLHCLFPTVPEAPQHCLAWTLWLQPGAQSFCLHKAFPVAVHSLGSYCRPGISGCITYVQRARATTRYSRGKESTDCHVALSGRSFREFSIISIRTLQEAGSELGLSLRAAREIMYQAAEATRGTKGRNRDDHQERKAVWLGSSRCLRKP